MDGFRDFTNPSSFPNKVGANNFVSFQNAKQNDFIHVHKFDPCLEHYKVLINIYRIEYMEMEATLTKSKDKTLLKRTFPSEYV